MAELETLVNYRTPDQTAGRLSRLMPTLAGYFGIFRIVWWSRNHALRNAYNTERWLESSHGIVKSLERVGVRFEVSGLSHVPVDGRPYVFLGNHMSTLETFVLPWILREFMPASYVIKEALTRFPVFKHVVQARNPIVVTRTQPREDLKRVLQGGLERLNSGESVIIFPQTTRTTCFDPTKFTSIGVKLAARAGVDVVPLAVRTDAWRTDGWPVKDFGRIDPSKPVHIAFGAPLAVHGNGRETNAATIDFISEHLRSWGLEVKATEP